MLTVLLIGNTTYQLSEGQPKANPKAITTQAGWVAVAFVIYSVVSVTPLFFHPNFLLGWGIKYGESGSEKTINGKITKRNELSAY